MNHYRIFTTTEEYEPGDEKTMPVRDVQAIIQDDPDVGVHIVSGGDYYIQRDGNWIAVDIFGLFDFLMDTGLVLFGRTVSNDDYRRIWAKVKNQKAGFKPGERRP